MVRFEKELWKFSEIKETHSIDETNNLLDKGWKLLEANASDGKRIFILGREKQQEKESMVQEDVEAVKSQEALEEAEKFKEQKEGLEVARKGKLRAVVFGPVLLAIGL